MALSFAAPVALINSAFESPGQGRFAGGFDGSTDIPGWRNTGGTYTNSGVELALQPGSAGGYVNTSGYVGFLKGSDGGAFQVTPETLTTGKTYRLSWKAGSISGMQGTANQRVRLFRTMDNGATRTVLATSTATLNSTNIVFETYLLSYTAAAADAGAKLGIELENTSTGTGVIGFDDFELELDPPGPAPATGIPTLAWDDGATDDGTATISASTSIEREYHFLVTTQANTPGAWRGVLRVASGNADVYVSPSVWPTTASSTYRSNRATGDDGFVISNSTHTAGLTWRVTVRAQPGTEFTLFCGNVFVTDLPGPAFTDSNSNGKYDPGEPVTPVGTGSTTVKPEGLRIFRTVVPAGLSAWSLWLHGDEDRKIHLRKDLAAMASINDGTNNGRMLVVPAMLDTAAGGTYYLGIAGEPGDAFNLDSRVQEVQDMAFESTASPVNVTGPPYRVFKVAVPVDQIAWDVSTVANSGDPNLCIRKDLVGSDLTNSAISAAPGATTDSVTLVPDFLTQGTWYVTTYGRGDYNFTLKSGNPEITEISFNDLKVNDQPNRAGSRIYRISDIPSQLGPLGWELTLRDQVPGTGILLRRNKVPSSWQSGKEGPGFIIGSYSDFHDTGGLIQRPAHVADIWYVTVHTPQAAMGAFTLDAHAIAPTNRVFEGFTMTEISLRPGKWKYVKVEVPDLGGLLGWDLGLENVTGGIPQIAVRRNALPITTKTVWSTASTPAIPWPAGNTMGAPHPDWTQRADPGFSIYSDPAPQSRLRIAAGNPLVPGVYYIGIYNGGTTAMNFDFVSKIIGHGEAVDVKNLAFTGGTSSIVDLAPREGLYYKVTVPANTPSWEMGLAVTQGEMNLVVRRDCIPVAGGGVNTQGASGNSYQIRKVGSERFVILPAQNQDAIVAGDYYIAVVSEGQALSTNQIIGTGNCSGTLTSYGSFGVSPLGAASSTAITRSVSLEAGQLKAYTFSVPAGAGSLEVRLDNRVGNPAANLIAGSRIPASANGYGSEGGQTGAATHASAITMVAPAAGTYTVLVRGTGIIGAVEPYSASSATLVVTAKTPAPLAFNGGISSVSNQGAGAWSFYQVTVPATAGIMGWDLMLRNVTGTGTPKIVVRRDAVPVHLSTNPWAEPDKATSWPAGNSLMAPLLDWTQRPHDVSGGTYTRSRRLVMAMGAPLEPGSYYVGVLNDGAAACSYILESRGIGSGQSIAIDALGFAGGNTSTITNLSPRQAAYRKVAIPAQTRSWEIITDPNPGEVGMFVRFGTIPTITGGYQCVKTSGERFVMLAEDGQDFIVPGDYYVAVVSEGQPLPPDGQTVGVGAVSATIASSGELSVNGLGEISASTVTVPATLLAGQLKACQFSIPAGLTSLNLRLDNVTGGAKISVMRGARFPNPDGGYDMNDGFGGGQRAGISRGTNITLNIPVADTYTLLISASAYANTASGNLVITPTTPAPPEPLVFDGGSVNVSGQSPLEPRYFQVTVPENAAILGWDVRLKNVSGSPRVRIRRDQVPDDGGGANFFDPSAMSSWATGQQWNGTTSLVMGMGRPLQPGTYFISVYNTSSTQNTSYMLLSRGIGQGQAIPVLELGSQASIANQASGESAYFSVNIPAETPSLEFTLDPSSGDMKFAVRRDYLPDNNAASGGIDGTQVETGGLQKAAVQTGSERFVILPGFGENFLIPGIYYIAATTDSTVNSSAVLANRGPLPIELLGNIGGTVEATRQIELASGQFKVLRFILPQSVPALEINLSATQGAPWIHIIPEEKVPVPVRTTYGFDGGEVSAQISSQGLVNWSDAPAGTYTILVRSSEVSSGALTVRQRLPIRLNFSPSQNAAGGTNTDTRTVAASQVVTYDFPAAAEVDGGSALGWIVRLNVLSGTPPTLSLNGETLRLPKSVIVPPLFNPSVGQRLHVVASGNCTYSITSEPANRTTAPWEMPGGFNGIAGDTGEGLPGDQGTDLVRDEWHYYPLDVPEGNNGLLRTELRAISGKPELYIREGALPSLDHSVTDYQAFHIYSRSLASAGSQYGNWVPLDGKESKLLNPGRYYVGVRAGGASNVRYRLIVSTGMVTDLALDGASVINQALARDDWRYYRFTVPQDAPTGWKIDFSEQSGDVSLFIRDTVPPGNRTTAATSASWATDTKNQGPYVDTTMPGQVNMALPPLRPGHTYFVGMRANSDAVFSLSSTVIAGTSGIPPAIDFYSGTINSEVPAGGSLLYRIIAPSDAARIKWTSSHASTVQLRLEQGTFPALTGTQHFASNGEHASLSQLLSGWPWVPEETYYLRIINQGTAAAPVILTMDGKNMDADDEDRDGLPDAWERRFYRNTLNNGDEDLDEDGIVDLLECAFNLSPIHSGSTSLVAGTGISGMPVVTTVGTGAQARIRIEYIRLRSGLLTYIAEASSTLGGGAGSWVPLTGTPMVTPIDNQWERVIIEDTAAAGEPKRFGRLRVAVGN